MSQVALQNGFSFLQAGKQTQVHPERATVAAEIDTDKNHFLSQNEIMDYLQRTDALEDPTYHVVDKARVVEEFQSHLLKQTPAEVKAYHSYEQVGAELDRLATAYPDLAKKVSLGKTAEGRDIWALKISKDAQCDETTSKKPGVIITGCHHAREWMSLEVPLRVANDLLDKYSSDPDIQRRVDNAEIIVVPLVNPDGYEYSRSTDNWWRKNRRPVEVTAMGLPTKAIGTDLNRNYDDGKPEHATLYRPAGDTPGATWDDIGQTSDNPTADTYRGNKGASEPEVQAMLKLELGRGNIKGILDHHGYGEMILYPWGATDQPVANIADYLDVGTKMNNALTANGGPFRLMQSNSLYPTSGCSHDIHQGNGILSFTLEVGKSFQPKANLIEPITRQVEAANMVFIDEILARQA